MKPKTTLHRFLLLAGSSLLAISYSHAATLYWDGADSGANAQGGAGTWDNGTTSNWDTAAFGGADSVWTNGTDTAVFGGTAGTVTLGTAVSVGGLTLNTTAYTIAAGTNGLTFSSGTNNIWLSSGFNGSPTATITGTLAGTGANLNLVANPGATGTTLILGGTSTGGWDGTTTVNSGFRLEMTGNASNQALLNTSAINLNGGTIAIGNGTTGIDSTRATLDRINNSATITVNGGGTIAYDVNNSSASSETVGTLALNSGLFSLTEAYALSSGSSTFTISGLSRTGAANTSAVNLQMKNTALSTSGFQRVVVGGIGANTAAGEIVGPWFTTTYSNQANADYIVYSDGGGGSTYYAIGAGIAASAESAWSTSHAATSNYTLTNAVGTAANGLLTATRNINTLRNTSAASAAPTIDIALDTVTVAGSSFANGDVVTFGGTAPGGLATGVAYYVINASGTTFQVAATSGGITPINLTSAGTSNVTGGITLSSGNNFGTYGILNGSAAALAIGGSGTGAVTLPTAGAGNLYLTPGTAGIIVNAPIVDNSGALTLVKSGSGNLFLSGANTYTGGTVVNSGTATFSAAGAWVSGQNLTFGGTGGIAASVGVLSGGTLTVNQGATGSITGTSSITFGTTSGAGQIIYGGGSSASLNLGNASGFTGNAVVSVGIGGTNPYPNLTFSSIADTAGSFIGWGGGGQGDSNQKSFVTLTGNAGPVTLNNRQIAILGRTSGNNATRSAVLLNNNATAANSFVINTDLINNADRTNVGFILDGSNTGDNTFAGAIGNSTLSPYSALNVYKNGAGKWILSGNNTFTGRLIAGNGTLSVGTLNEANVAGPLGMNNTIQLGGDERGVTGTNINVILGTNNSGTLEYTGGAVTSTRTGFLIGDTNTGASTGGGTIANNGSGAITFSAATFNNTQTGITSTRSLSLAGANSGNNEIQGIIQDNNTAGAGLVAVIKSGTGTWKLSGLNTYTGKTTAAGGTLEVTKLADGGLNSSIGASTNVATNLDINNTGILRYVGTGDSTDRLFRINGNAAGITATLDASGSGVLNFTNTGSVTYSNNNQSRVFNLTGSNTGDNTFAPLLTNNGTAFLAVNKDGAGTWVLTNNHTYSGATTVNAGKLTLGVDDCLADVSDVVIGNGILNLPANVNDVVDTLDCAGAATINLGSGATLAFSNSSAVDWTDIPGTLNITGTFVSGSSIRFGTDNTGLTAPQLAVISVNGSGAGTYSLDSSGYLVSGGAPVGYAAWQAANGTAGTRDQDHDNDGVDNGTEHFLGGTVNTTGFTPLPSVVNNLGTLSVTWTKAASYTGTYGTDFVVETSDTLTSWSTATTSGTANTPDTVYLLDGNNVTYTFPATGTKKFARLKVTGP